MIVRRASTETSDDVLKSFDWVLKDFGPHIFTNILDSRLGKVVVEVQVGEPDNESELWVSKELGTYESLP